MRKTKLTHSVLALTIGVACPALADETLDLSFAGALEFSDTGTLFVGDNYNGAIYAFDMTDGSAPAQINPVRISDIDVKIADVLGVPSSAVAINDMAVHPVTAEIIVSVTRIGNFESAPAVLSVSQSGEIALLDLAALPYQKQTLTNYVDQDTTFRPRGVGQGAPLPRDLAKGEITLSSLAIMDMEFHEGELFVSGVAYDNFLSSLRRMPYPFTGDQTTASVEIYHLSHDQNETRAPIRAMSIQEIDGRTQIVAAYTCSPIVLIGLDEIEDGAHIIGRAISDYGNGQPIDMVSYAMQGQEMLFLTSNSRSPQVIPLDSMQDAQVYTAADLPRGGQMDLSPTMPIGPVGKAVMFDGMSLHIAPLGDDLLVSMTRDLYSGSLNLDSNPNSFPNRFYNLIAEYDFPQYWEEAAQQ